jgi:hypothetical protein
LSFARSVSMALGSIFGGSIQNVTGKSVCVIQKLVQVPRSSHETPKGVMIFGLPHHGNRATVSDSSILSSMRFRFLSCNVVSLPPNRVTRQPAGASQSTQISDQPTVRPGGFDRLILILPSAQIATASLRNLPIGNRNFRS